MNRANYKSNDIDKIRGLISLYFNGETSSEQEKNLYDFFINHNKDELPEDLKVYYDLLFSLAFFSESPPQEFIEKFKTPHLKNNTSNLSSSRLKLSFWLSLSAAVFIGVIISIPFLYKELERQDHISQNIALTVSPEVTQTKKEVETIRSNIEEAFIPTVKQGNGSSGAKKNRNKINLTTFPDPETESYDYVEIQDINEAAEIIVDINNKLTSLLSHGKESTNIILEINQNICQTLKIFKTEKNENQEI